MATTKMVDVRVDKRPGAGCHGARMGVFVSDVDRVLLTRVAAEKALPFEVKAPHAASAAAMVEARKGGLTSCQSVSDLMAALNAEDWARPCLSPRLQAREARTASARRGGPV